VTAAAKPFSFAHPSYGCLLVLLLKTGNTSQEITLTYQYQFSWNYEVTFGNSVSTKLGMKLGASANLFKDLLQVNGELSGELAFTNDYSTKCSSGQTRGASLTNKFTWSSGGCNGIVGVTRVASPIQFAVFLNVTASPVRGQTAPSFVPAQLRSCPIVAVLKAYGFRNVDVFESSGARSCQQHIVMRINGSARTTQAYSALWQGLSCSHSEYLEWLRKQGVYDINDVCSTCLQSTTTVPSMPTAPEPPQLAQGNPIHCNAEIDQSTADALCSNSASAAGNVTVHMAVMLIMVMVMACLFIVQHV
jgi:hypothetical protein